KKFACARCQRGHRNASCDHLQRPVLEVRSVGRPISAIGRNGHPEESKRIEGR
ncbi:hypothetical protein BDK51DRAFT_8573, partial [Blyttiomyces helicus]